MKFSLIVPLAPERNAEILECIKKIDYPKKDFETIVERGKNASENRNNGIKKAKGRIIIFLDDDAYLNKDYLTNMDCFFKKYRKIDIVGGPQLTPPTDGFFAKISGAVLESNFGAFEVNKRYKKGEIILNAGETSITSANLAMKKEVIAQIGGFDKRLFPGEDPEFINRAKKNGLNIAYNPEMVIYHKRREIFSKYIEQIFNYGFTRPKVNKISKKIGFIFLIPMFFSIYFVFLPFLSKISSLFMLPFMLYVFLALIFGFYDSIKHKILPGIFILPFLYLFTHVSYGFGMLLGYIKR